MSAALIAEIEGYAALFGAPDMNGDIVARGAFAARRDAGEIRLLYQHAPGVPIGRWRRFAEDSVGLYAQGELLLDSAQGREAHALLRGGALDGLSIGFRTVRARRERSGARLIVEADLWEVSVVTFPMADGARVLRVGAPLLREDETAGPAAGAPQSAAGVLIADALRRAGRILQT